MSDLSFYDLPSYQPTQDEEFMCAKQVEHFRNKLLMWKDQLVDDAEATISHIQKDSTKVADINDRATLEEEFSLELRTRDRERKLINKIEQILHVIDLGDYGYCKTCGSEISLVRLDARPTADECIDCKTIAEKREV